MLLKLIINGEIKNCLSTISYPFLYAVVEYFPYHVH